LIAGEETLTWPRIQEVVQAEQRRLSETVKDIEAGQLHSELGEPARLEQILGITCHAVYHAGQIQLIKRLHTESNNGVHSQGN
jgi:hypothetical protein